MFLDLLEDVLDGSTPQEALQPLDEIEFPSNEDIRKAFKRAMRKLKKLAFKRVYITKKSKKAGEAKSEYYWDKRNRVAKNVAKTLAIELGSPPGTGTPTNLYRLAKWYKANKHKTIRVPGYVRVTSGGTRQRVGGYRRAPALGAA
jgi:hypothetical protein